MNATISGLPKRMCSDSHLAELPLEAVYIFVFILDNQVQKMGK